jgi:hypothetical protein
MYIFKTPLMKTMTVGRAEKREYFREKGTKREDTRKMEIK